MIKLQLKINGLWLLLIAAAGIFCLLYIWFTLFPGRANPEVLNYFTKQQVEDGRAYSFGPRLLFAVSFLAQAAFLIWLVFGGKAVSISRLVQQITGRSIWSYVLFFLLLWLILKLIALPFDLAAGFFWQHQWGFSTQTLGAWWLDYLKSSGLELVLSGAGVAILFGIIGRWPNLWWLITAALVSLWLVLQTVLWPVLISPLFNRFEPVRDPKITTLVQELSQKAQLPVDQVLVMDASKRTTKANAYFTGLFGTKRIVLYDNLLSGYPLDQVKAVVAHEMAHWKQGHIIKGLLTGIAVNFIIWLVLFLVLQGMVPSAGNYPPYTWAVMLLFFLLVSFAASPVQNHFSRAMEREADRVSVQLTEDVQGAVQLEVNLAVKNLSDVSPPNFIRWFSYSHPPALTRINDIIEQGRQLP